jgi:hypothetical protein
MQDFNTRSEIIEVVGTKANWFKKLIMMGKEMVLEQVTVSRDVKAWESSSTIWTFAAKYWRANQRKESEPLSQIKLDQCT